MQKLKGSQPIEGPTVKGSEIKPGDHVRFWYVSRGRKSFRLGRVEKRHARNPDTISVRVIGLKKCCLCDISITKDVLCVYQDQSYVEQLGHNESQG